MSEFDGIDKSTGTSAEQPYEAQLVISGWHGTTSYPVIVIGSTPKRFRVRAIRPLRLPARGRTLAAGEEALVPKTAVRFTGPVLPRSHVTNEHDDCVSWCAACSVERRWRELGAA